MGDEISDLNDAVAMVTNSTVERPRASCVRGLIILCKNLQKDYYGFFHCVIQNRC